MKSAFFGGSLPIHPFLFCSSHSCFLGGVGSVLFDLLKRFGFGVELDITTGEAHDRNTSGIFQTVETAQEAISSLKI